MSLVPPLMRQRLVSIASASTHAVSVFPVPVDPVSATTSGSYRPDRWLSLLLLLLVAFGGVIVIAAAAVVVIVVVVVS